HALFYREPAGNRRPLLAHGLGEECRRLGGSLRRPASSRRLREELDSQPTRQSLVRLLPPLRTVGSLLRQELAAAGLRVGQVSQLTLMTRVRWLIEALPIGRTKPSSMAAWSPQRALYGTKGQCQ